MPNALDLLIIAALTVSFIGGWQMGFLTRVSSWLGLGAGLIAGARALPWIVERLDGAESSRLFFTIGVVLFALGSIGLLIGLLIGSRIREAVSGDDVRIVDRLMGALASCVGLVFIVWLLVPLMADVPQWPAQQARNSRIAQLIDNALPNPPDNIQALGRLVGPDRFPQVLDALQPTPEVADPPMESGLSPSLTEAVVTSVLRIEGTACRRLQSGSGFVIDDELVVTNAHVVAGESTTQVVRNDGVVLDGVIVFFDPARDLAVLQVRGLDRQTLPVRMPELGEMGAVFGFPGGGELRIAPFQLARRMNATGRDIYNGQRVNRDVFILAADLAGGDSGAALVGQDGHVLGVAFAIAPDRSGVAYALTAEELFDAMANPIREPVDTGPCLR